MMTKLGNGDVTMNIKKMIERKVLSLVADKATGYGKGDATVNVRSWL